MVGRLLLGALLALGVTSAPARSEEVFTAERLVGLETLGGMRVTPDGRWVVIERQGAYDSASTYSFGPLTGALITDLMVIDASGRSADLVIGVDDDQGYQAGPIAPDGRRMVIYRLSKHSRALGVLSFDDRKVRWFDISPQLAVQGRTVAWRGSDSLVVMATTALPHFYRLGWETQATTQALWRRAQGGQAPTATFVPSGATRDARPQAAPLRLLDLDLKSGAVRTLLTGDLRDFELSPDAAMVAVVSNGDDVQFDADRPAAIGAPTRRRRLTLVEVQSGRIKDPDPAWDVLGGLLAWSPNSRTVLVVGRKSGSSWDDAAFLFADRENGQLEPLMDPAFRPAVMAWDDAGTPVGRAGWIGDAPIFLVRDPDGSAKWRQWPAADAAGRDFSPHARFARRGGVVWVEDKGRLYAPGQTVGVGGRIVSDGASMDAGERAFANPTDHELGRAAVLSSDGCLAGPSPASSPYCLSQDEQGALAVASSNGQTVVFRRRSPNGRTEVIIGRAANREVRRITLNAGLDQVTWPEIRRVSHAGDDGQALSSWLLLPPGPPPAGGWPLVVRLYPGDAYEQPPAFLMPGVLSTQLNAQVIAAGGYAVLAPSLPSRAGRKEPLQDLASRIDAVVSAAAAATPINAHRVALVGHSYGGYAALMAAAQGGRYQAVVASAALADLATSLKDTRHAAVHPQDGLWIIGAAGWLESGQGGLGVPPWMDAPAYLSGSPIYHADRFEAPILLIHGDLDPVGAEAMFAALYRLNHEAGLLTYWGEGHNLASPANIVDLHRRVLQFLDERLAGPHAGQALEPGAAPDLDQGAH